MSAYLKGRKGNTTFLSAKFTSIIQFMSNFIQKIGWIIMDVTKSIVQNSMRRLLYFTVISAGQTNFHVIGYHTI